MTIRAAVVQTEGAAMDHEASRNEAAADKVAAQFADEAAPADVPAWEQVDVGRYMPRRIRGSCKGRALG